jgi:hypothetical protein
MALKIVLARMSFPAIPSRMQADFSSIPQPFIFTLESFCRQVGGTGYSFSKWQSLVMSTTHF